jgi:hypothetical protein
VPYSEVDDLLLGDLPLGSKVDPRKYIQDAADEIDSVLGFNYVTPIDISDGAPTARYVKLLLKRINNHLASGRLILAVDVGGEDSVLHAYGVSLIQEATAALTQIINGMLLEGAEQVVRSEASSTGPTLHNEDDLSSMQSFYDYVMKPQVGGWAPVWEPGEVA